MRFTCATCGPEHDLDEDRMKEIVIGLLHERDQPGADGPPSVS